MIKISSQQVARVLSTVPHIMRGLVAERDSLLTKCASLEAEITEYKHNARIENLAKMAEDRCIGTLGATHEERVQTIKTAMRHGRSLEVMEEAIKMASKNGSIGVLGDDGNAAPNTSSFEQYILFGTE
jgi:hypothetical protein